nr:ankyrin repeat domain-containing protein [Orientia tsutsugamushi]
MKNISFHDAVQSGKIEEVKYLLAQDNAIINSRSNDNYTALHLAALYNKIEVAELLLENEADVSLQDSKGYTALHWTALLGNITVARLLLKKNPDIINLRSNANCTALHLTAIHNKIEVAELLLENEADVSLQNSKGYTALHWTARSDCITIAKLLLKKNPDIINLRGNDYSVALHLAARFGYTKFIDLLLENNADVNLQNVNGDTAIDIAARFGNIEAAKSLLKHGSNISLQKYFNYYAHNILFPMFRTDREKLVDELLVTHVLKYEFLSQDVNSTMCIQNRDFIKTSQMLREIHKKCKQECEDEIKKIKDIKINSSSEASNMYNIYFLQNTNGILEKYANDTQVKFFHENCEEKFPIFGLDIVKNIEKGKREVLLSGVCTEKISLILLHSIQEEEDVQIKENYSNKLFSDLPSEIQRKVYENFNNELLKEVQKEDILSGETEDNIVNECN